MSSNTSDAITRKPTEQEHLPLNIRSDHPLKRKTVGLKLGYYNAGFGAKSQHPETHQKHLSRIYTPYDAGGELKT